MKEIALVVSCEHAVNTVPEAYKTLFAPHQHLLNTHRGFDIGTLTIARAFVKIFNCDFVQARATRLLIDCNRSLWHRLLFSEITKSLPKNEKELLIQLFYLPYRQKVEDRIKTHIQEGKQVLHLSIHSFTPVFNEVLRNIDIGLLYDPKRKNEKMLAQRWQQQIKQQTKNIQVRMNCPYRGIADGFTTALRKQFAEPNYIGIEIESNQKLVSDSEFLNYLASLLTETLKPIINQTWVGYPT
ncbi:MAG: N-formylglutamate amidohydrolase [Tatlockia sp.]|nr:N-formylglutamate amidohydrolase [Tatlockia sp.]